MTIILREFMTKGIFHIIINYRCHISDRLPEEVLVKLSESVPRRIKDYIQVKS